MRAAVILCFAMTGAIATVGTVGGPGAMAGDPRRTIDARRALGASALPKVARTLPDFAVTPSPPDPPALSARRQWIFDLRWDRGDVWLLAARALDLSEARRTPRVMGRFALELFEGPTLIERVRFDFPLLGAPESEGGAPSLSGRLRTRIGVFFPDSARGTRLELVDRATQRRWSVPWPPVPSSDAPVDAGPPPTPHAGSEARAGHEHQTG